MADGCLDLLQWFAGLNALVPRVIKLCVTSSSAVSEPSATATATTAFPRFRDNAAFDTCGTDCRRRGWWCVNMGIGQTSIKMKTRKTVTAWSARESIDMHGLTFAGLGALKPRVISVAVAGTSAVLIPSTSRSAATDSA